jgi:hypothetical protein
MEDFLNLTMLVGASVGAIAFGLFTAYGLLGLGFAFMQPAQKRVTGKTQQEHAGVV